MTKLLRVDEAAQILRISPRSLHRHFVAGTIRRTKIGGRVLVEEREIMKALKGVPVPSSKEADK